MKVISTEKVPIKMWLDDIEDGALEQAKNTANLPFVFKHVAIMPDSHKGFGAPIGGVVATKNVIISNFVGKDIGCGMCAVKTSLTDIDKDTLKKIMGEIRKAVPVGFEHHKEAQDITLMPDVGYESEIRLPIVRSQYQSARKQIGTLGGGNHFIEIQKGSDGHIWIMIHSGSRNLGLQVADHYNKIAIELNEKWHSSVPKQWELAFLPVDSDEGRAYIREMNYCVDFALANRKLMMARIGGILQEETSCVFESITNNNIPFINIAHNYAKLESICETCIDNQGNDNQLYELLLGDPLVSKARDSLVGCRPLFHSCGGLLLLKGASVLKPSPLQVDALVQMNDALHYLIPQHGQKHNHSLVSLCPCECESPSEIDKALNTFENKFGLGFSHLFGVENNFRKLDRVLGRIFLGFEAYSIEHNNNKHLHSITECWVHRKGATLATRDTIGIIPGSQGTASYIVRGKGCPDAFNSCSHGAGRKMGRGVAQRTLNLEEEKRKLDEMGVIHSVRNITDLDEAPGSYKDINTVMENQKDLVEPIVELTPLAVIKG